MQTGITQEPFKVEYTPSAATTTNEIVPIKTHAYIQPEESGRGINYFASIGWLIVGCGIIVLAAITIYVAMNEIQVPGFVMMTGLFYAIGYLFTAAVFLGMGSIVTALWDIRDELRYQNDQPQ